MCVLDDAGWAIELSPALFRANRQHVVQLGGQIVIEMQANHVAYYMDDIRTLAPVSFT